MGTYTGGWSIGDTTTIYTIKEDNVVKAKVTVTGLKSGLTVDQLNEYAIVDASDGYFTITLKADALGTTTVAVSSITDEAGTSISANYDYAFALDSDVKEESTAEISGTWTVDTVSGTKTATYSGGKGAYYTLTSDDNSYSIVTYTAAAASTTLAKITGLNSSVTADALATATTNYDSSGKGKIQLTAAMLPTGNTEATVTLSDGTDNFDLALASGIKTQSTNTYAWADPTGTDLKTALYKKTATAFYTLSSGTSVTYTPQAITTEVALSNLASTVTTADALKAVTSGKVVTLTKDMLSTTAGSATTLTPESGITGYSLALANTVPTSDKVVNVNLWTVADATGTEPTGTKTATYAEYKPEHFTTTETTATVDEVTTTTTTVNYVAQDRTSTNDIAKITGLKNDLTATTAPVASITGITFDNAASPTKILLDSTVLPTTNSAEVILASSTYTLGLKNETQAWAAKDSNGDYWTLTDVTSGSPVTVTSKTATYQYDSKTGYELDTTASSDTLNKKLTYKTTTNTKLFDITGISKDYTNSVAAIEGNAGKFASLTNITFGTDSGKEISLTEDVLDKNIDAILIHGTDVTDYTLAYKFTAGTGIQGADVAAKNMWETTASTATGTNAPNGTATYAEYKPEHYKVGSNTVNGADVANTKISYVAQARTQKETPDTGDKDPLAVITGLNITEATTAPVDTLAGIKIDTDTISLDDQLLPTKNAAVVQLIAGASTYALALDSSSTGHVPTDYEVTNDEYWTIDEEKTGDEVTSTTAKYQRAVTAGYTVSKTSTNEGDKNDTITYTDDTPKTIATITGLAIDLKDKGTAIAGKEDRYSAITGIGYTAPTAADQAGIFELANSALQSDGATLSLTSEAYIGDDSYKGTYKLALDDDAQVGVDNLSVINDSGTGKVTGDITGYKLTGDDMKVDSAAAKNTLLAEISNLKSGGSGTLSINDKGVITIGRSQFNADTSSATSTLTAKTDTDAETIADTFTLSLARDAQTKKLTGTATVEFGAARDKVKDATVKGTLANYVLTDDKTVTYTETADQILATIANVNKEAQNTDFTISGTQIKLAAGALVTDNTSTIADITLTNQNGSPSNYKLAWANPNDSTFRRKAVEKDVWTSNKGESAATTGTATYKTVEQDYYSLASDGSKVEYKARADVAEGTKLTITGLKKDALTVANDAIEGISFDADNPTQVNLAASVLPDTPAENSKIEFTTGSNDYSLKIDAATNKVWEEEDTTTGKYWTVEAVTDPSDSGKTVSYTAYYKYDTKAGYKSADGKTYTYTVTEPKTLFTITGLASDFTVPTDSDKILAENTDSTKIKYKELTGITNPTALDPTIKLATAALTKDATIATELEIENGVNTAYTLALDNAVEQNVTTTYAWDTITDHSSTYKKNANAYHTLETTGDDANKKVTYTAAIVNQELAKVENLAEGTTAADLTAATSGKVVTLTADMLSKTAASKTTFVNKGVEGETYTLELDGEVPTETVENDKLWTVADATGTEPTGTKTATYAEYKPEHFTTTETTATVDEVTTTTTTVNYVAQDRTSTNDIAKITGLKNDLTATTAPVASITGIAFDREDPTKILLDTRVLPTEDNDAVTLTSSTLTLALATSGDNIPAEYAANDTTKGNYWTIADADTAKSEPEGTKTATYKYDSKTGYELTDSNKILTYHTVKENELFKITGLNSGITASSESDNLAGGEANKFKTITGITNPDSDNKITLAESVLNPDAYKATTLTNGTGITTAYTLALGADVWTKTTAETTNTTGTVDIEHGGRTYAWAVTEGSNDTKTAIYRRSTHAYYTLATGNKSISYTAADTDRTLATITNLNKDVYVVTAEGGNKGKVGIGTDENFVEGIAFNGTTKNQIDILNASVLSTDNTKQTKFTNAGVAGETYTFALKAGKTDVPTSDTVANINLWTVTKVGDTYTATYAEYKPEFFTLNDDDSVTYTELKRARNGQVPKDEIAVITGLTIDSTTATGYATANIANTTLAGITLPTGTSKAITLDSRVLTTDPTAGEVIELTGTGDYTLAIDTTNADYKVTAWGPGTSTETYWAVKGIDEDGEVAEDENDVVSKTANYQYDTKEGYKADSETGNKKFTYTASTPTVVATITGLNAAVTVDTENTVGNRLLTEDRTEGITVNKSTKVFTIASQDVLQAGNVKLDGDYTFAALTDNIDKPSDIDTSKGDDGNYWTLTDVKEKEATATTAAVPATKIATYQYDYKAGYTLDSGSKSITYTAAKASAPLAVVTGLSADITGNNEITDDNGYATGKYSELTGITVTPPESASATGTIEITDEDALTTSDVNLTSDKYTLALDSTVIGTPKVPEDLDEWYFTIDEDTTTNTSTVNYKYDLRAGYELDTTNKKIAYTAVTPTTVATITGLATGLKTASDTTAIDSDTGKYSAVAGIAYEAPVAEGEEADDPDTTNVDESKAQAGIFKLNTTALTTGNVALTTTKDLFTGGKAYLNSYTLALQTTAEGAEYSAGNVPTEAADGLIWTVSPVGVSNNPTSTKAYLNPTKEPYYKLGTNGNAVTYNPQVVNASILTISGLAPAVYTATKSASKEPTANKNAFETYLSYEEYVPHKDAVAANPDADPPVEGSAEVQEQIGKVKLKAAALNNASVTLTGTDKYVIDSTSEFTKPTESITGWKLVSGNPVLYGKITAEGYALKPDGKTLDYTAASTTEADLVKIEGFNSGLVIKDGKLGMNIDGVFAECIKYDANNNTVTISKKAVLGASDVEFTTNKIGYTLELDASSGIQDSVEAKDVWREKTAGSGTYEYKNVNLAYYTEAEDGSGAIEYHAEEANKTKNASNADVDIVYATITGLKGNLGDITTDQISVTEADNVQGAAADDEDADANKYIVTILNKEVLAQTTASITSGMDTVVPAAGEAYDSAVYSLAIDDACKPAIGTDTGSKWWEAEDKSGSTTATYHAAYSDGYKLKDDGKIYYVNAKDDVTLATITGLKSGLTKDALNATENTIIVPTLASGNLSVKLTAGVLGDTDATIAMTDAVKEDYSLSDYNLTLDSGVKKVDNATATNGWWLTKDTTSSLTTATWANITPYYYTIFATADQTEAAATKPTSGKKIKYTGDAITKNTKGNEITYFKVTGLSKDLVLDPNAAYGVYTSAGTMDGTTFNEGLTFDSNTVKAKANVLSEKVTLVPITTESEGYALTYDYVAANGDTPKVKNYTYKLEFADGTATLKQGNEAYYKDGLTEPDGKVIKYHAAVDPDTVVTTVTGLSKASDLLYALQDEKTNAWSLVYYKDGQTEGTTAVSFTAPANEDDSSTAKKVTIEDATALSKASVEVTGDYTLALKDTTLGNAIKSQSDTDIWYRDETAGTLTYYTGASEGYNLDAANKKLVYTAFDPKTSTKNVAIKGLDLKVGNNGANVGTYDDDTFKPVIVNVDKTAHTVTLGLDALGTSNVEFVDDTDGYTFNVNNIVTDTEGNKHVGFDTKAETWTVKSGTVTYKHETDKGFTLSKDSKQIRYTAPTTVTATITGLDKTKVADAFTENTTTGKLEPDATKKLISVTTTPKAAVVAVPYTGEGATGNLYEAEAQVKGVINISSDLFGTNDVAVSSDGKSKGLTYEFAVAGSGVYDPSATTTTAPKVITEVKPAWNVKSGKATYDKTAPKDSYVSNTDGDKLTYYKAEKVISTIVTIAGLDKAITAANFTANVAVEAPTDHAITNADSTTTTENYGTITLSKGALPTATKGTLKVTLTNGKEGTYRLALDTTSASTEKKVDAPEDKDPIWIANGKGTATYQYQTTAGYVVGNSSKDKVADVITASAETWTPIVTLTGVNKKLAYTATDNVTSLDGIKMDGTTDANHNPILTLTAEDGKADTIYALDNTTIKLKNNTKDAAWKADVGTTGSWAYKLAQQGYESAQFKLAVDDSVSSIGHGAEWSFNNGTATLAAGTTAGYAMKNTTAADTAEYKKATSQKAVVTITGLPKTKDTSITMDGSGKVKIGTSDTVKQGLEVLDNAGGKYTVKVYSDLLDTVTSGTIKVKEANAYLSIDGQSKLTYAEGESGAWNIVKGKATLDRTVATAGHTLSADGKSITYTPTTKSNKPVVETLATITGLDKKLTLKTIATYNESTKTSTYKIVDDKGNEVKDDNNATLTSLESYISLPVTNEKGKNIVTLGKGVLSTSKITIKGANKTDSYALALDSGINTTKKTTIHWDISGNKASLVKGDEAYYTIDSKTGGINYNKAGKASTTYVTVTGIDKTKTLTGAITNATDGGTDSDTTTIAKADLIADMTAGTVTLNNNAFDTTPKSIGKTKVYVGKNDAYTLVLGTDATAAKTTDAWSYSKGKATLERNVTSNGYLLSDDSKTITYGLLADTQYAKKTKATTLATISGVKDAPTDKADSTTGIMGSEISIGSAQLDGKKVTLKVTSGDYYLNLAAGQAASISSTAWGTPKNGKVSLTGIIDKAGYAQSDNYTINYIKPTTKATTIATVSGLSTKVTEMSTSSSLNSATNAVTMAEADLKDAKNVTVDGVGVVAFGFSDKYYGNTSVKKVITGTAKDDTITAAGSYVSITTAAGNDKITVTGGNVTVNAGKGNDYVDLGNGTGNVFIYASGDGNDIVADFTNGTDKLDVKAVVSSVDRKANSNDVIISVDKGKSTITVKNYDNTAATITVGSKAYDIEKGIGATDLLLDNNYSMTAAADDLSEIIKADTGSYSPYQFNNSLKLTKEENFIPQIAYGSNKK